MDFFIVFAQHYEFFIVFLNTMNFFIVFDKHYEFFQSLCAKIIIKTNKTHDDGEVILEAIAHRFDWFFHASVDYYGLPPLYKLCC